MTDFRSLCAELRHEFASLYSDMSARIDFNDVYMERIDSLLDRAADALTQSGPHNPTDEELDELGYDYWWLDANHSKPWRPFARTVLEHWGHHARDTHD